MLTSRMRVLAVTGGHRVNLEQFLGMVAAVCESAGWVWAHAIQPSAQRWLHPACAGHWDAILLHDIPGLALHRGEEPVAISPDRDVRDAVRGLLDAGQGLVVTHHALAGWPAWEGWATALGGRYLYSPGTVRGAPWPSSGYRMATHHIEVLAPEHPVCAGVEPFDLDDELYLCPVFTSEVVPLLATTADIDTRQFTSTYEAVTAGREIECRDHPPGSRLVGWAKSAGRSPLVYLQPGHGPETMQHLAYRQLLRNSLAWVASPGAHAWAADHPTTLGSD